jgi:hypothetical protein
MSQKRSSYLTIQFIYHWWWWSITWVQLLAMKGIYCTAMAMASPRSRTVWAPLQGIYCTAMAMASSRFRIVWAPCDMPTPVLSWRLPEFTRAQCPLIHNAYRTKRTVLRRAECVPSITSKKKMILLSQQQALVAYMCFLWGTNII